ncbi:ribonuclease E inhibitor RraB [Luteimonas arsenica]|uniref:ribonuclease E inhibitor RraB n=1 Tax=Luteimonas arsenica TaxID=1586242 RepID=UPI001056280B|nr:ribonuclease E inhibitor RraB [Luteimonas arsenica]
MGEFIADWPDDADGGVFRRLAAAGFDFSQDWSVDYNVDFEEWPPAEVALELLRSVYGSLSLYPPDEHGAGYVQFQVVGPVTYEGVTSVQRRVSATMLPFGGVCESWGVMH